MEWGTRLSLNGLKGEDMPAKTILEVSGDGDKYAKEIFGKVDFKLLGLPTDEQFEDAAKVILIELGRAFAEGYFRGVEDQRKRK